ncbi:winged helix-turn-helix transcriptional regulator [Aminipila luticellarii]|uniref:Winged helix-turn-helix transcriptional regulator n=1 Tax=Aminipila luticellarii TaxID=2507160 RepID=A0A410PSA5_9FIRM|nr:winged helix-turn-helix transcriptional regulator [Aminipila luticellarii]QAT41842.1 hypothetical protein EQM06_00610 [Aminipila luticellarii]
MRWQYLTSRTAGIKSTEKNNLVAFRSRKATKLPTKSTLLRKVEGIFKVVGLVEQLGSGMSRILKVYDKDIFRITDHFIKAIFPFSDEMTLENTASSNKSGGINGGILSDEDKLVKLMQYVPSITVNELSNQTGLSTRKISRISKELRETGKITRIGSTRKGAWQIND